MKKAVSLSCIVPALALSVLVSPAVAQDTYPVRPVRILVGFSPGGNHDIFARIIAKKLTETWGQPVIVDNRPGANGMIATETLAKAPPDGHTLHVFTNNDTVNVSMHRKLPYDTLTDLAPVTPVSASPYLLGVHPSLPVKTVRELIALAKARPGQLSYASSGAGSGIHLSTELLKRMAGIDMVHVPYKGSGLVRADLLGGQIKIGCLGLSSILPSYKAGQLRIIAVTTAKRSPELPEIPAIAETVPGYDASLWSGILAPRGTPSAAINRIQREVTKLLQTAEVQNAFQRAGTDIIATDPKAFGEFLKVEYAKWGKVVRDLKLQVN